MTSTREDDKRRLRAAARSRAAEVSAAESAESGRRACRHLLDWAGFAEVESVAAYSTLAGEVASEAFIDAALANTKRTLLPRIVGDSLEFAAVEADDALVAGRFGVLEPGVARGATAVAGDSIVLVPGLAFDRFGGRLGRGAGYYDRALAAIRRSNDSVRFIGVGFSHQVIDRVPMGSQDVRMHGILTQEALVWVDDGREPGIASRDPATGSID